MMAFLEGLKESNDRGVPLTATSEVAYFAPTLEQARRNSWALFKELGAPVIDKVHENTCLITLVNGVRIRLLGMDNPDAARGLSLRFAILDEYADMPAHAWSEIIRPALSDMEGGAIFIGTPKGRNHFFDVYTNSLLKPEPTDARITINPWNQWESFSFEQGDNPLISDDEKMLLAAEYTNGSEALYDQEIRAQFITAGGEMFHEDQFVTSEKEPPGQFFIAVDLAGFAKESGKRAAEVKRLDNSAIAVVKVQPNGHWWVKEIIYGKWDVRETALNIVKACRDNDAIEYGIERGALFNAVGPYLEEYQRQLNCYIGEPVPLTHGNQKKYDRVQWALQGRLEKGQITFNPGTYLETLIDEATQFPSRLAHDDLLDALAYIDQIAQPFNLSSLDMGPQEYVPLDAISGY